MVDSILRNKLQKGVDGDLVGFLLNCRVRFGNNPAQLHISYAKMYGELERFMKAEELSEQIKRWLDYQKRSKWTIPLRLLFQRAMFGSRS